MSSFSKSYYSALDAYASGRFDDALSILNREEFSGPTALTLETRELAASLLLAGNIHAALGEVSDCDRRYREAFELLSVDVESKGDHVGHATVLVNHSSVLIRRYQVLRHQAAHRTNPNLALEALRMLDFAYKILEPILDANRVILADCCHNIGVCLEIVGNYVDALEYYMKSLKIRCRSRDQNDLTQLCLATTMENVAMVYRLMHGTDGNNRGNVFLEKAEEIMRRVASIRKSVLGSRSGGVAEAKFNLALISSARGNLKTARNNLMTSRGIRMEYLGPDHDLTTLSEIIV